MRTATRTCVLVVGSSMCCCSTATNPPPSTTVITSAGLGTSSAGLEPPSLRDSSMDTVFYRATSDTELGRPLGIALAEAAKTGKRWFHLVLAPGTYNIGQVNFLRDTVSVRIDCEGDVPAVFTDATFDLEGP